MKPAITLVCRQDKMDEVEHYAKLFISKKFDVTLQREVNPGITWEGTEAWERIKRLEKLKFVHVMDDESIPPSFDFKKYEYCNAGQNYFCAISDGTVYKCYSDMLRGDSIGNIFEFRPFTEFKRCDAECRPCGVELKLEKWNEPSRILLPEEARIAA